MRAMLIRRSRVVRRTLALGLAIAALATLAHGDSESTSEPALREVSESICRAWRPPNRCADVRDAEARRYFPELRGRERVWACTRGLVGTHLTIAYAPDPTGEHRVATRELVCEAKRGRVRCGVRRGEAHFVDDASAYFEVGDGVAVADAISVARALREGRVSPPAGLEERARLVSVSRLRDGGVSLGFDECGCWASRRVERDASEGVRTSAWRDAESGPTICE
jgi:hypothetical protein